jgi:ribosomal protein S18 acetylase RimI-like enzyme
VRRLVLRDAVDVPDVTLRPCSDADHALVLHVRREAFRTGGDVAEEAKATRALASLPFAIVETAGKAIGYVSVVASDDHDLVHELAVLPQSQGRGIGTAVIRGVQDDARRRGVPVRLSVHDDNPARRLYERLGFAVTDVDGMRVKMEWRP